MIEVADTYEKLCTSYWSDRVQYFKDVYGKTPTSQQGEQLSAMDKSDAPPPGSPIVQTAAYEDYRVIASGNGTGKTDMMAGTGLHFFNTRAKSKSLFTASSAPQLHSGLWPRIGEFIGLMKATPLGKIMAQNIVKQSDKMFHALHPDTWTAIAQTADKSNVTSIMGIHAGSVGVFGDEGSDIDDECWNAFDRDFGIIETKQLVIGNPLKLSGRFYDAFHGMRDHYKHVNWSVFDSEIGNISFANRMIAKHGKDHRLVMANVYGQFPTDDADSWIKIEPLMTCINQEIDIDPFAPIVFGVDPAYSKDRCIVAILKGNVFYPWKEIKKTERNVTRQIVNECARLAIVYKPKMMFIDSLQYGNAIADLLDEMGFPVTKVMASGRAKSETGYWGQRDVLWGKAQDIIHQHGVKFWDNDDKDLQADYLAPKYTIPNGTIKIESKDEMATRGVRSTDVADAHNLCFHEPIAKFYEFTQEEYSHNQNAQPQYEVLDAVGGY